MAIISRSISTSLALALSVAAYGPPSGFRGYPGDNDNDNDGVPSPFDGSNAADSDGGFGGAPSPFPNFDMTTAGHVRLAHGVLACAAFAFFFPVGAISIRVIPSRWAVWIHAACQLFAYAVYVAAFALGVWLVRTVRFGSFDMLTNPATSHHPAIGILLLALLSLQPVLGLLHHLAFRKHRRRTAWSHAHLWLGRALVTLGIVNGGLGLRLAANAPPAAEAAYGVVAGAVWLVYVAAAVYGEVRRRRRGVGDGVGRGKGGAGSSSDDEGGAGVGTAAAAAAAGNSRARAASQLSQPPPRYTKVAAEGHA